MKSETKHVQTQKYPVSDTCKQSKITHQVRKPFWSDFFVRSLESRLRHHRRHRRRRHQKFPKAAKTKRSQILSFPCYLA